MKRRMSKIYLLVSINCYDLISLQLNVVQARNELGFIFKKKTQGVLIICSDVQCIQYFAFFRLETWTFPNILLNVKVMIFFYMISIIFKVHPRIVNLYKRPQPQHQKHQKLPLKTMIKIWVCLAIIFLQHDARSWSLKGFLIILPRQPLLDSRLELQPNMNSEDSNRQEEER